MPSSNKSQLVKLLQQGRIRERIQRLVTSWHGAHLFGEHTFAKPGELPDLLDHRPYMAGDPVRDIDWKVWARTEELFVRRRQGTGKANLEIMLDSSGSMRPFYGQNTSKWLSALILTYIVASIALRNRDRINIRYHETLLSAHQPSRLLDLLLELEHSPARTPWPPQLLGRGQNQGYLIVMSDFFCDPQKFIQFLHQQRKHFRQIYLIHIEEPLERDLQFTGERRFVSAEKAIGSKKRRELNVNTEELRQDYQQKYQEHFHELQAAARQEHTPWLSFFRGSDPIRFVHQLLI